MTTTAMAASEPTAPPWMAEDADPLPPIRPAASVGPLRLLQAFRSDVLAAFSASAYTDLRVSFRRFGRRFIFLSAPEDINHVLNTHMARYQPNVLAERLLEPLTGRGIVLLEGDEWQQLHRQLMPVFQPRHIERLLPSFHDTAASHVASWSKAGDCERNLLVDFRRLTLDIIARSMLSIEDESRTTQLADFASMAESAGALLRWQDYVAVLVWRNIGKPAVRQGVGVRWRARVQGLLRRRFVTAAYHHAPADGADADKQADDRDNDHKFNEVKTALVFKANSKVVHRVKDLAVGVHEKK